MASVRKHPKSKYWFACFQLPDGRFTQRSTRKTDKGEAMRVAFQFEDASRAAKAQRFCEAQARKVIADIFQIGNRRPMPGSALEPFLRNWLKRKKNEMSGGSHDKYTSVIDQLVEFLGPKAQQDLCHLSTDDIVRFRDHLADTLSVSTTNVALKVIRAALSQAVKDGLLAINRAAGVKLLKDDRADGEGRRAFTLDELRKVLSICDAEWKAIVTVGFYTGLRIGDIANLKWFNIDMESQELSVKTAKTGRQVVLPIATPLFRELEKIERKNEFVFPKAQDRYQRNRLSNDFYELLVKCGLATPRDHKAHKEGRDGKRQQSPLTFHSLRHSATTYLKRAGVSDAIARDIIGHESVAVSKEYTHLDYKTKRQALDAMPDILAA